MEKNAFASFVLIVLFLISVFPMSTFSGVAASHGSSGVSEFDRSGGDANGPVSDQTSTRHVALLPRVSGALGRLDANAPQGSPFCQLLGTTFTESFSSMSYNVTAVPQNFPNTYYSATGSTTTGPAYLLCGISDQGYLYEVGLSWDYCGTVPFSSGGVAYTPGWNAFFIVFNPAGNPIPPYDTIGILLTSIPITSGSLVQLALSCSGGIVTMYVHDWNTPQATSQQTCDAYGATYFVGLPNSHHNSVYSFSGLMTEQYHTYPYTVRTLRMWQVVYSDMSFAKSSAWMWMREIASDGTILFDVTSSQSPVSFVSNPISLNPFIYPHPTGEFECTNAYQFATGSGPMHLERWVYISPSSATLTVGSSQTFTSSLQFAVAPPCIYQWYLNGAPVSGATSSSWTFAPTSPGSYTVFVQVTDILAQVGSAPNTATVTVSALFSVSILPSSVVMSVGESRLFTSTVTGGTPPYTYLWYHNGIFVPGATNPTWTFTPTSQGSGTVYLTVTDSASAVAKSNTVPVTVNGPLSITVTPSSATIGTGQSQLFTSTVSGGTSPFAYQWYLNGVAVSSATSSTWTFTPSSTGSYSIYANVTDNAGLTAKSNIATLTVTSVSVTISPASVTLNVGQSQLFTSSVSGGTPPYSYQWYLNGALVSGATSSSWTFTPSSAGTYTVYVRVADTVGEQATSNTATATVTLMAVDWWPMFHHDLMHTGYPTSTAPTTNQTLWSYTTGGVVDWSSPAVVNGVVFVGSDDTNLYALNASTGALLWKYTTGSGVPSSPAVVDGVVFVGSQDGKVYALNATTGAYIWSRTTGNEVRSSPAVVDGVVFVGSLDGKVYALNAKTGAYIWSHTTGDAVFSSPAVAGDVVFVGSNDNKTYALNATTGKLVWSYTTAGSSDNTPPGWAGVWSSPAVANNVVYVGSLDSNVYALNASTGTLIWKYTTGNGVFSCPAVVGGVVFVGSWDGKIYALNATTGKLVWSYAPGYYWVWSSPAVATIPSDLNRDGVVNILDITIVAKAFNSRPGDPKWNAIADLNKDGVVNIIDITSVATNYGKASGVVYVGSQDGNVYALNAATGALVWSYTTGGYVDSSPAVANGVIYVGSWDGKIYAFGGT